MGAGIVRLEWDRLDLHRAGQAIVNGAAHADALRVALDLWRSGPGRRGVRFAPLNKAAQSAAYDRGRDELRWLRSELDHARRACASPARLETAVTAREAVTRGRAARGVALTC